MATPVGSPAAQAGRQGTTGLHSSTVCPARPCRTVPGQEPRALVQSRHIQWSELDYVLNKTPSGLPEHPSSAQRRVSRWVETLGTGGTEAPWLHSGVSHKNP